MNETDLLKGFSYIDENLIEEAEKKKKRKSPIRFILPIAAGFTIILTAFFMLPQMQKKGFLSLDNKSSSILHKEDFSTENSTEKEYTLYFNNVEVQAASRLAIEGHFFEELTSFQLEKLFPGLIKESQIEGIVNYSYANKKLSIFNVEAKIQKNGKNIKITIAPNQVVKCYEIVQEPVLSEMEGVEIEAGLFITDKNSKGEQNYIYSADFKRENTAYSVEYAGKEEDREFFTSIIADLVLGGTADLSVLENPSIPELREEKLTETEAYAELDFGSYLPKVPDDYQFNEATRFLNQTSDYLFASWSHEYEDIRITISKQKEQDKERIVSAQDTKLYDMSLYPIPWSDSMPIDLAHIIENPIFKIEDLTPELLKMREYIRDEAGDPSGNSINMRFSVLYNDILVEIFSEGVSSEYLFQELLKISHM